MNVKSMWLKNSGKNTVINNLAVDKLNAYSAWLVWQQFEVHHYQQSILKNFKNSSPNKNKTITTKDFKFLSQQVLPPLTLRI